MRVKVKGVHFMTCLPPPGIYDVDMAVNNHVISLFYMFHYCGLSLLKVSLMCGIKIRLKVNCGWLHRIAAQLNKLYITY